MVSVLSPLPMISRSKMAAGAVVSPVGPVVRSSLPHDALTVTSASVTASMTRRSFNALRSLRSEVDGGTYTIAIVLPRVGELAREFLHEMNSESAAASCFHGFAQHDGRGGVGVEGAAVILDGHHHAARLGAHVDADLVRGFVFVGVAHDVDHELFDDELHVMNGTPGNTLLGEEIAEGVIDAPDLSDIIGE